MANYLLHIFIPMIGANILHMLVVKKNNFSFLAKPININLFGKNKTWRGFFLLPLFNGALLFLFNETVPLFSRLDAFVYGFILGVAYMLFELPNSFLKRKSGIKAGEKSEKNPLLYMSLDKTDSALGVSLASTFIFGFSWKEMVLLFLTSVFIHILVSLLLVVIGVKKRF